MHDFAQKVTVLHAVYLSDYDRSCAVYIDVVSRLAQSLLRHFVLMVTLVCCARESIKLQIAADLAEVSFRVSRVSILMHVKMSSV